MELLNLKDVLQKVTADREQMIKENDKVLVEVYRHVLLFLLCRCCCFVGLLVLYVFPTDQTRLRPVCL